MIPLRLSVFSNDLFCNLLGGARLRGDDERVQHIGTAAAAVLGRDDVLLVGVVGVLVSCGACLLGEA